MMLSRLRVAGARLAPALGAVALAGAVSLSACAGDEREAGDGSSSPNDAASSAISAGAEGSAPGAERLFVWSTDSDSIDLNFLAVVDAERSSPRYGQVLTTLPVPTEGRTRGHHTEHRMPAGGLLFANDFGTGKTYVLDLQNPNAPTVADSFAAAGGLMSPHSFERLPNGNVLATFQNEGAGNTAAGGIAELGPRGRLVRSASAGVEGEYVRPYSLAVVPSRDRVITGSADMRGEGEGESRVLQIWRLSDLALLHTIRLPEEWGPAAEPRLLGDGETVLLTTFGCRLLKVDDLNGDSPTFSSVFDFGGASCALPVVVGDFWIQGVPERNGLVVLDVSDPAAPREVSSLVLESDDWPHWIAANQDGSRLVLTGYGGTRHRVLLVDVDVATGALTLDLAFSDPGAARPGISFDRETWPHGASGPADPHGAVFSRSGG